MIRWSLTPRLVGRWLAGRWAGWVFGALKNDVSLFSIFKYHEKVVEKMYLYKDHENAGGIFFNKHLKWTYGGIFSVLWHMWSALLTVSFAIFCNGCGCFCLFQVLILAEVIYDLVGGLEHSLFSHILGIIIPTDFHIFQRGGPTTNQWLFDVLSGPSVSSPRGLFYENWSEFATSLEPGNSRCSESRVERYISIYI